MRLRYGKWTVLEVEVGICLAGIVGYMICGFVCGISSPVALGVLVGTVGGMMFLYSMAVSMETTLDMGNKSAARKHSMKMQAIRYGAVIFVAVLLSRSKRIDVVTALLTLLFSIKIATFIQPVTHKLFCRWFGLSDELNPEALYLPEEEENDDEDEDKPDRIDRWMDRLFKK